MQQAATALEHCNESKVAAVVLNQDASKVDELMMRVGGGGDAGDLELRFSNLGHKFRQCASEKTTTSNEYSCEGNSSSSGSELRLVLSNKLLKIECDGVDLAVELVQALVIDRLRMCGEPAVQQQRLRSQHVARRSGDQDDQISDIQDEEEEEEEAKDGGEEQQEANANNMRMHLRADCSLAPIELALLACAQEREQLEQSERRIEAELYESADFAKSLMQQLAIANDLNEL